MSFTKNKIFFILLSLCVTSIILGDIVPDPVQPIRVVPPNTVAFESLGTTVEFKFSTDTDFKGLSDNMAISIQFDQTSSVNLVSDYTCTVEVRDGPSGNLLGLTVKTIFPKAGDRKSALCVLDEEPYLTNGAAYYFFISVNMSQSIPVHKIKSAWISFTTSTDLDRMLITPYELVRSTPNFDVGTDFKSIITIKELSKENVTPPSSCSAPCEKLYPYSTFTITVILNFNNYFQTNINDNQKAVIGFSWPNTNFDFTNAKIDTQEVGTSGQLLDGPLLGVITLADHLTISSTKVIAGVTENMYPNRQFKLIISDITGPDYVTSDAENALAHLIFIVYHVNDYARYGSVSSQNYITEPIFKVNVVDIITPYDNTDTNNVFNGIYQADYQDIYENASWPVRFVFDLPPMPSGGYVKIDHDYSTYQIFNFISSTCDFSSSDTTANTIFSGILGQRPVCYPVQSTLTQKVSSTTTVESGVFFKMPTTNIVHTVTVQIWGVAAKCSENDYLNPVVSSHLNLEDSTQRDKNSKKLTFSIRAYKSIDQTSENTFTTENLIAQKTGIQMYGKCHGTMISHKTSHNDFNLEPFYSDTTAISATKEVLLFKEFNNWNLSEPSTADGTLKFLDPAQYLYLSTIASEKATFDLGLAISKTMNTPIPGYIDSGTLTLKAETMKFYISRGFVTKNSAASGNCHLMWFNSELDKVATADISKLQIGAGDADRVITFDSTFAALDAGSFETDYKTLHAPMVLISSGTFSTSTSPGDTSKAVFITNKNSQNLGFQTNCYKVPVASNWTSMYTYLDFTYTFEGSYVNRVGRFVKLMPSVGVFHPVSAKTVSISSTFYFAFSSGTDDMCLLKINKEVFNQVSSDNVIILTLLNIKLLNIDATDYANTYPVSPLESQVFAYSSDAVYPFSFSDVKTHGGVINKQYLSDYSAIAKPFSFSDLIKNPASDSYYNYLGSVIYILNKGNAGEFTSGTAGTQADTYLPVYCPRGGEMLDNKDHLSFVNPSINVVSASFTADSSIDISKANVDTINFDLNSGNADGLGTVALLVKRSILEPATSNLLNRINVYFSEYSTTNAMVPNVDQLLYVKGSIPVNGIPPETKCDSMILFLTNLITNTGGTPLMFDTTSISAKYTNADGLGFYYKYKKFTKAFFHGIESTESQVFIKGDIGNTEEYSGFKGIDRPTISTYTSTNPNLTNDVAFTCLRVDASGQGAGRFYNNYDYTDSNFEMEFLKLNSDDTMWDLTIYQDSDQGTIFKADKAYKLDISIEIDSSLPTIGSLSLKSPQLVTGAVCAINNVSSLFPAAACSSVLSNTITCPLKNAATQTLNPETLDVCCYNILIATDTEIIVDNASTVKLDTHSFSTSFLFRDAFTGQTDDSIDISTGFVPIDASLQTYDEANITPTIVGFYYGQTSHENGLGVMYIQVNLARPTVPNQRVKLQGVLPRNFISGYKPTCEFYYNNITIPSSDAFRVLAIGDNVDYEYGNYLADKCVITYTDDTPNSDDKIEIYNKNYIYRCKLGKTPHQYMMVKIYPVIAVDLSTTTGGQATVGTDALAVNQYKLSSGVHDFESANYIAKLKTATFPSPTYLNAVTVQKLTDICNVFNILPSTVGQVAEYIFKIDLSGVTHFFNVPDEVSIYFDVEKFPYPASTAGISCALNDSTASIKWCNWERSGFFNIGLTSGLVKGLVYYLKITGLINSTLDADNTFPCSLNKYDGTYSSSPEFRTNEITSIGTNIYVNYFEYVSPDESLFDITSDYSYPINTPYLSITGPLSDGKYKVEHITTKLVEQNNFKLYFIYDSSSPTVITTHTTNFNNIRDSTYKNKALTHGNFNFITIDLNTQVHSTSGTLETSFVVPSFRFLMPNMQLYTDSSDGADLAVFIEDSLNDFLLNNIWPYFTTIVENNIRQLRLDYNPSRTLSRGADIYFFWDSSDTTTTAESAAIKAMYDALASTGDIPKQYTRVFGSGDSDLNQRPYKLFNMQNFDLPSVRMVLPNGVMRMFNNENGDLQAWVDDSYTNYYSYTENVHPLIFPIYRPKLYVFIHTSGTAVGGEADSRLYCRHKLAQDLLAGFYQFKTHYDTLTVLNSKELDFIDLDMNNTQCENISDFDGNPWPAAVLYFPDGRKFTFEPTIPDTAAGEACDHQNFFWDIDNLVQVSLKKYISLTDIVNTQLQTTDAAVMFIGNSVKDRAVFDEVIVQSSVYLPYFYCSLAECLDYFRVSNGDAIFINSRYQPYVVGTTDTRVLPNGYTATMLTKFISASYSPRTSEVNDEIMYQIFYKRNVSIFFTYLNNANASTYQNIADEVSIELRGTILVVTNTEDLTLTDNATRILDKLRFTRSFSLTESGGITTKAYTDTSPYVWIIDNSTVFKRFKLSTSVNKANILAFYNSWKANSLTPEAISEALPNYTELISNYDTVLSSILPIVRSNFETRTKGDSDDVVVIFTNNNIDYSNTLMLYFLEVAKYYSSRAPRMQFYQINMSLNELPDLNIEENSRLPAIKIYTKRNNKITPYDFHDDINNYVDSVANYKLFLEKFKFHPLIN